MPVFKKATNVPKIFTFKKGQAVKDASGDGKLGLKTKPIDPEIPITIMKPKDPEMALKKSRKMLIVYGLGALGLIVVGFLIGYGIMKSIQDSKVEEKKVKVLWTDDEATIEPEFLIKSKNCPEGWHYFEETHSCYKVVQGNEYVNLTFYGAKPDCELEHAYLASIHSENEHNFVYGLLPTDNDEHAYPLDAGYYLGIQMYDVYLTNDATGKNIDGTPFDYARWADDEPNNGELNEVSCVLLYPKLDKYPREMGRFYGRWNDVHCEVLSLGYICKKSAAV